MKEILLRFCDENFFQFHSLLRLTKLSERNELSFILKCKFFSTFGDCKFQDDCSFLHVIPTDKLASAQKEIDVLKSEIGLLEKNLLSIQNKFENMETLEKRTEEIFSKIKIFYK